MDDARTCDTCRVLTPPVVTLATHSVTDVRETAPGVYEETVPRYGCQNHRVASMVYPLSGGAVPYEKYAEAVCQ